MLIARKARVEYRWVDELTSKLILIKLGTLDSRSCGNNETMGPASGTHVECQELSISIIILIIYLTV